MQLNNRIAEQAVDARKRKRQAENLAAGMLQLERHCCPPCRVGCNDGVPIRPIGRVNEAAMPSAKTVCVVVFMVVVL